MRRERDRESPPLIEETRVAEGQDNARGDEEERAPPNGLAHTNGEGRRDARDENEANPPPPRLKPPPPHLPPPDPQHSNNSRTAIDFLTTASELSAHGDSYVRDTEFVFQKMSQRKLERALRGTYENDKPFVMLWVFLTLMLLFGIVAPNLVKDDDTGKKSIDIQLNTNLGFISVMAVILTGLFVYTLTRVVMVVRWSLYWLFATLSILYLWKRNINLFSSETPTILLVGFGVMEFITFAIYITTNFLYPPFLASEFFRRRVGVTWWWGLRPVYSANGARQPWTFTYNSGNPFQMRRTCTYRGETHPETGIPHGFGHWLDDSFNGELLSGIWYQGEPVGPFRSREFGSGYAFENLRIGFVMCSDDSFSSRRYFPSQVRRPVFGVASVECSVAGGFFSHLPKAKLLVNSKMKALKLPVPSELWNSPLPQNELDETSNDPHGAERTILRDWESQSTPEVGELKEALADLKQLYAEHPSSSLIITATKGRGVVISGHSFSGSAHEYDGRIVLEVVEGGPTRGLNNTMGPPFSAPGPGGAETAVSSSNTTATHKRKIPPTTSTSSTALLDISGTTAADALMNSSLVLAETDDDVTTMHGVREEDDAMTMSPNAESTHQANGITPLSSRAVPPPAPAVRDDSYLFFHSSAPTTSSASSSTAAAMTTTSMAGTLDLTSNAETSPPDTPSTVDQIDVQLLQQQQRLMARPHDAYLQNRGAPPPRTSLNLRGPDANAAPSPAPLLHSEPYIRVKGWKSTVEGHAEALVFVPGFNASLEHDVQRLGQFMSMGRFPPHIKPFVFAWPCGRELTYLWAQRAAVSLQTKLALGAMIKGLAEAGITDFHFLVHSLGAQVVLRAFCDEDGGRSRSWLADLFADVSGTSSSSSSSASSSSSIAAGGASPPKLRLRTVTLLHPDTPLSSFVNTEFACLRRVCTHITVVGDRKDGALDWSEMGNGLVKTLRALAQLMRESTKPVRRRRRGLHPSTETQQENALEEGLLARNEETQQEEDEKLACGGRCDDVDTMCCRRFCGTCCRWCIDSTCRPYHHAEERLFSRVLAVGRNIFSLYMLQPVRSSMTATTTTTTSNGFGVARLGRSQTSFETGDFVVESSSRLPSLLDPSARLAALPYSPSPASNVVPSSSSYLPSVSPPRLRYRRRWLDLDAIDTSSMEQNVHQLRHAYFDLNKILVEDLHELIVTGKRAGERSLLLHREGNFYSFCQAPACVVNR